MDALYIIELSRHLVKVGVPALSHPRDWLMNRQANQLLVGAYMLILAERKTAWFLGAHAS
eukprot:scaffold574251_cov25-Prasinocladus_malaysianus.AAC.1